MFFKHNKSIRTKVFAIFIVAILLFFSLLLLFALLQKRSAGLIQKENSKLYKEDIIYFMNNRERARVNLITNFSHWPEFASQVERGISSDWYLSSFKPVMQSLSVSYLAVFDAEYNILLEECYVAKDCIEEGLQERVVSILKIKGFNSCFLKMESGYMRINSEAIQAPSKDGNSREVVGYIVMGCLWDSDHLASLSKSMRSNLSFERPVTGEDSLHIRLTYFPFKDNKDDEIGGVWFVKDDPIFTLIENNFTRLSLFLVISFIILSIVIRCIIIRYLSRPLKLVEEMLTANNGKAVTQLRKQNDEFSIIADLFEQYQLQTKEIRYAKERVEQSERLKSRFIANMGHEIRTPLNGIMGFAELLKDGRLSAEERERYVEIINASSNRMLEMVTDLMLISKVESGQEEVNLTLISLEELINNLSIQYKQLASNKGLSIITKAGEGEELLYTDKEKVYKIFKILIHNAIKFSDSGEIEIGYLNNEGRVQFYVKDQGIGIDPKVGVKIFDLFIQGDESYKNIMEGVGLGLAIARAYTNLLGGEIWFESSFGKGSIFYFTVPYYQKSS